MADEGIDFFSTDPGTLGGRFMRRFWQPVQCSDNVKAGEALPVRVMGEDLTLYRGESGAVHLVAGKCAHRGTVLHPGWVEGDAIRCLYHGWKYAGDGRCLEQPAERSSFADKIAIAAYPVKEYLGLVWAWLGEGPAPALRRFRWLEGPGVLLADYLDRGCNYFQHIENTGDEVHVAFTHRTSLPYWNKGLKRPGVKFDVPTVTAEETDYGVLHNSLRETGQKRQMHYLMPSINIIMQGPRKGEPEWRRHIAVRVPIDDTAHRFYRLTYVNVAGEAAKKVIEDDRLQKERIAALPHKDILVERILAGTLKMKDVAGHPDLQTIEDDVTQIGQGRIHRWEDEHLGPSDVGTVIVRRIWARELSALAAGRPMKEWKLPEDFDPFSAHPGQFVEEHTA